MSSSAYRLPPHSIRRKLVNIRVVARLNDAQTFARRGNVLKVGADYTHIYPRLRRLLLHFALLVFLAYQFNVSGWGGTRLRWKKADGAAPVDAAVNLTRDAMLGLKSRFHYPWKVPKRVKFLTIAESRNRILYSPLRASVGDGIGHAFGIMNAEVGAALRFGLAYFHRRALYGSLTIENQDAVEDFFGWGVGNLDRAVVRETVCNSSYAGDRFHCQVCEFLVSNSTHLIPKMQHLVEIPFSLTYKRERCQDLVGRKRARCDEMLQVFLKRHDKPNTLFQMATQTCNKSPVDPIVDRGSRAYFFHKYWDKWGSGTSSPDGRSETGQEEQQLTSQQLARFQAISSHFRDDVLTIAVHARRGDFFRVKTREMISCETYAAVIREVMQIVKAHGGIFAQLPVSVHIYSEGGTRQGFRAIGHNVKLMTKEFFDSDGKVRNATWMRELIRKPLPSENSTHIGDLFGNGLDVKLHIAKDTLQSMHEMIAADVFIGSASAMGKYVVSALSRGAFQLMPYRGSPFLEGCCHSGFRPDQGILKKDDARKKWREYADANGEALGQALNAKVSSIREMQQDRNR